MCCPGSLICTRRSLPSQMSIFNLSSVLSGLTYTLRSLPCTNVYIHTQHCAVLIHVLYAIVHITFMCTYSGVLMVVMSMMAVVSTVAVLTEMSLMFMTALMTAESVNFMISLMILINSVRLVVLMITCI
jgi:hypothetical protein